MRLVLSAILLFLFTLPLSGEGWKQAEPNPEFQFPDDEYAHPDYRTEWWYFTGNLRDADGQRYGYQLTFFRQGIRPPGEREPAESRFVVDQFWFAHLAISHLDRGVFEFRERLSRGVFEESGSGPPADECIVWVKDWSLHRTNDSTGGYRLKAEADGLALDLTLQSDRPPILQGKNGYSPKSSKPGNASYYFSHTRLQSEGIISIGNRPVEVEGNSWYDREWSTSALDEDQVGWDWFSVQLEDGRDLMLFQLRDKEGKPSFLSGTLVAPDGSSQQLTGDDFQLQPFNTWESTWSDATYPIAWNVALPEKELSFRIEAVIPNQELVLGVINYWEGATRVLDPKSNDLLGRGFLEMTGYSSAIPGLSD